MEAYWRYIKVCLTLLSIFLLSTGSKSQSVASDKQKNDGIIECVFIDSPEFAGGRNAMLKYLSDSTKYPKTARDAKIEGKVFITFVVTELGYLEDVKVLKWLGYGLDEEALRLVHNMSRWTPGKMRGKSMSVKYNLPIVFKLGN